MPPARAMWLREIADRTRAQPEPRSLTARQRADERISDARCDLRRHGTHRETRDGQRHDESHGDESGQIRAWPLTARCTHNTDMSNRRNYRARYTPQFHRNTLGNIASNSEYCSRCKDRTARELEGPGSSPRPSVWEPMEAPAQPAIGHLCRRTRVVRQAGAGRTGPEQAAVAEPDWRRVSASASLSRPGC